MAIKIDRQFMFLHQNNLSVFVDRVLRNTQNNPYIPYQEMLWEQLREANRALRIALDDPALKRKERTEVLRAHEAKVLIALGNLADYIELNAPCKSDVYTTGFRPHAEHRRATNGSGETRRIQRMNARMAKIEMK
ncbi:MAG: hypothetical protein SFV52_15205 [Saprospiraceae bacterium]|nr:hypothetical protein [Saprospiraceae bacterium]